MKANVSGVHGPMGQKVNGFSVHIRLLVKGYFFSIYPFSALAVFRLWSSNLFYFLLFYFIRKSADSVKSN